MSQGLVVGISPSADPTAIQSALSSQQIDLANVKVVSHKPIDDTGDDSGIHFMDVEEAMEHNAMTDDITHGKEILEDSGGTSVPGLGGRGPSLREFTHAERPNYLTAFPIPDDEVDNFNGAIDEGRAVVVYPGAGEKADTVAAAFRAAGLRNVRLY
ncbi:MAG: hypothetical protein JO092_07275 [Candidatus Eremiobacteraeota bacterium]|nr:hypothetical protein [Candidatus Eremiobacteraeota bacterium]